VVIGVVGYFLVLLVDDLDGTAALPRSCIAMQMHVMLTRRSAMSVPGAARPPILAQRACLVSFLTAARSKKLVV
jgi:hypothetical protein